ncbi:SURF1 family protein, partial [Bordetella bronchiseptica]
MTHPAQQNAAGGREPAPTRRPRGAATLIILAALAAALFAG